MKRKPTYYMAYEDLRARLERGEFPIGAVLPKEDDFCVEYKISRYALREAVHLLERQGFLQRRRRAGTIVLAHTSRNIFRHAMATRSDLADFIQGTSINFSRPRLVRADNRLAHDLGSDEMRQWYFMEGVRKDMADGRPIGITQVYIDASRGKIPGDVDFSNQFVYEWLERRYNIRCGLISQDITAVSLSVRQAEIFSEQAGAPALRIMRRYFDRDQKIFQIVVTTHRSEGFVHNIRLQLE